MREVDLPSTAESPLIVVFDFDKTLSVKHVGPMDCNDARDRCFGGSARTQKLVTMLRTLHDLGAELYVLSRNLEYTVKKALGRRPGIDVLELFTSIVGNERCDFGQLKSEGLQEQILQGRPGDNLLFVDDDPSNTKDVKGALPTTTVRLIPGLQNGMNDGDMDFVQDWAANRVGLNLQSQRERNDRVAEHHSQVAQLNSAFSSFAAINVR